MKKFLLITGMVFFIVGCSNNSELINPKTSKQIQKRISLLEKTLDDTKESTVISKEKREQLKKEIDSLRFNISINCYDELKTKNFGEIVFSGLVALPIGAVAAFYRLRPVVEYWLGIRGPRLEQSKKEAEIYGKSYADSFMAEIKNK